MSTVLNKTETAALRGFIDKWRASGLRQVLPGAAIEHIESMFAPYLQGPFPRGAAFSILVKLNNDISMKRADGLQTACKSLERLWNWEQPIKMETVPTRYVRHGFLGTWHNQRKRQRRLLTLEPADIICSDGSVRKGFILRGHPKADLCVATDRRTGKERRV